VSLGGRAQARSTILRRAGLGIAILVVLTLILLLTSHWVLGIVLGVISIAALWAYLQARTVR
jgi:hypothetical protein